MRTIEDLIPMTVAMHRAGITVPADDPIFCCAGEQVDGKWGHVEGCDFR